MRGLPLPAAWDRAALEAVGFAGFVPFAQLRTSNVPTDPGIYIVLRTSTTAPELLEQTRARSGAPYSVADLQSRWIPETPVLYIGKAAPAKGGLRKRLAQYARKGSSHAGGRSIWQLADQDDLLVAWAITPGESPYDVEVAYRAAFAVVYKALPFANLRR